MECSIKEYASEKFVEKYIWRKELCLYFCKQQHIRAYPSNYYMDNTTIPHFFYHKTFHLEIFGDKNYSLSSTIYNQSYQTNIDQIIQQESNK